MKKKLFAILLCLVMILSSVSILSEVSFAEEEKTFVLKKADGTELGQYDEIKDGWDETTILGMMKKNPGENYVIEVTKDYEFTGSSRAVISDLNITFTSKEDTSPVLTSGSGMPHFFLKDGNYTFKNIILEGKSGSNGGGIYTHDDNQGITITLDKGTVIRNCNYIDAPYFYRTLVIRDDYDDQKDSTLIINDGVTIENNKLNSQNGGSPISVRENCKLIINGGEFKNNESQYNRTGGGVIFNEEGAETIINGGTFEGNKAAGYGGAIINYGKLTINDGTFKGNEAKNGGAISSIASNSELTVNGGSFENNKSTSKWGGAIVAKNKVSVKNATFDGNVSGNGGAIFAYDANGAAIENCTFKDNSATNENTVKHGGALFVNGGKDVSIKNNTFIKNKAKDGGALHITGVEGVVEGNTFEENFAERFSSAFHINNSSVTITSNTFKNNGKNEDKVTSAGTIMVESVKNNGVIEANGNTFENNTANLGGAAVLQAGTVDFNGCSFNKNNASEYGGAMYITKNGTVNITNSKFEENTAKRGGAIVTELFSEANPAEKTKYTNLTIADDVVFDKNFASDGYFNPPTNYKDFPDLKFKTTSLMGKLHAIKDIDNDLKTYEKVDSVLNNYDVYYVNPLITVTYDSNGGTPEEKIFGEELKSKNDEIIPAEHKVKSLEETGLKKDGFTFKEWNTKADGRGTSYKAGSILSTSSNVILYAIWNEDKPAPKPKPSEPSTVILTLDENYRGGEITNIEVEEGDLIEPHLYIPRRRGYIFRGWSYDQKHLDEVKPGDRIYSDTTLYAIWKRAEEEREEEPIEIKGEDHKTYIFGYPDGSVRPNGSITRAEAAAMLARLLNIEAIGSAAKPQFTDTDSSWYNKAINAVVFRGIMKGYPDGRFRPNAPITRAEFTQMISTIDNKPYGVAPFADVPGHWAERAIGSEYQAKRITGYPDGLFRPDANITRAEAAVILNKIFERKYDNLSLLKCKNPQMIKRFTDLDESFWGWNDMVEATNSHEYVRRYKEDMLKRLEEDWLLIK